MRLQTAIVLLCLVLFAHRADGYSARVTRVIDGDTVRCAGTDGISLTVRLAGIDAPEKSQLGGPQACGKLSKWILNSTVDVVSRGSDRYGRTIADVYSKNGRWINRDLVTVGWAWWYREYSTDRRLEQAELRARHRQLGVWMLGESSLPPWEYRKAHRIATSPRSCAH